MKLQSRHILLILGTTLVIISFFCFVSAHTTYIILLIIGLAVAAFSLMIIWFKDTMRMIIFWTLIATMLAVIQQAIEESAIKQSKRWMIQSNEQMLRDVSMILISKPADIFLLKSGNDKSTAIFTGLEWSKISNLFQKTDIKLINKDKSRIYYEVYGMLDARVGFSCSYTDSKTDFGGGMNTFILKWDC